MDEANDFSHNYYDWKLLFPELQLLIENIEKIKNESKNLPQVSNNIFLL